MSILGRENDNLPIQVCRTGPIQELDVDAAESVVFCAIGDNPVASSGINRFRISPDFAEYFSIEPGQRVAASGTSTGETSNPVGTNVTLVRILYDQSAGIVEVMECR